MIEMKYHGPDRVFVRSKQTIRIRTAIRVQLSDIMIYARFSSSLRTTPRVVSLSGVEVIVSYSIMHYHCNSNTRMFWVTPLAHLIYSRSPLHTFQYSWVGSRTSNSSMLSCRGKTIGITISTITLLGSFVYDRFNIHC